MVSIAMAVFPVCRSPKINSRCPRPIGISASTTFSPVCKGTTTGPRSIMGGAGRSTGRRWAPATGAFPAGWWLDRQALVSRHRAFAVERFAQRVDHPSQQTVSHRYVHDPAGAFDFVARVQILIFAEQDHADFILSHAERNAQQIATESHQFLIPYAGKA